MAPKYICPACDKKFVDWGAEKLNFKCPECQGDLESTARTPASKSRSSKKSSPSPVESIAAPKTVTSFDDAGGDAVGDDVADDADGDDDLDDDDVPLVDGDDDAGDDAKSAAKKTKAKAKTKKKATKE